MAKDESKLEELKENYKKIQKQYNLPEFNELNIDFSIEKVADVETDFLVREIGKMMAEKFSSYLRFVELMLNPINSPMFIFSIIKTLGENEKKKLSDFYKELTKIELSLIELDIDFSEEKEADFIKSSYKTWIEIKKDFLKIIDRIKSNWDSKSESNGKGYFG
ncbi:MAG: hypothetical protein WC415_06825 [Patescibacteria group bacterium]|jgi:hypothetical protein